VGEDLRKASLYFRSRSAYWQLTDPRQRLVVDPGPIGRHPLDIGRRLTSGHYSNFDQAGLPIHPDPNNEGLIHNYSTISGFALAHWDRYLLIGNQQNLARLLAVADYIVQTADRRDGMARLRAERLGIGHVGQISGLWQGQAMSVLCRAWYAGGHKEYLDTAMDLTGPFSVPADHDGVIGLITKRGVIWYEEYVQQPLNHVLNGMLYTLLGLKDLAVAAGFERAQQLFDQGIQSVLLALPDFDSRFWTWYCIPEQGHPRIASMGYHALHSCLLEALWRQTGNVELRQWAERFGEYATRPSCRIKAAFRMVRERASGRRKLPAMKGQTDENVARTLL